MTDALKNKVEGSKKWNVRTIQLDDYIPATSVQKLKNERGAGRKPSDLRYAKQAVMLYREDGYSMRKIAKIYGVSVGTVHKLINEQNKTG
jgi:DNA-binding NarL/FixJ family response regulator